jgi:hypothetical protein
VVTGEGFTVIVIARLSIVDRRSSPGDARSSVIACNGPPNKARYPHELPLPAIATTAWTACTPWVVTPLIKYLQRSSLEWIRGDANATHRPALGVDLGQALFMHHGVTW